MSTTFDEGFVVTDKGLALQSKQLAAKEPLRFSRAVYGDGMLPEGTDIRIVDAMVSEKLELPIIKSTVVGNGTVDIEVMVDNSEVEAPGFPLTEVGMYAWDGDEEVLYAYAYFGNRHGWIPSATDARKIRNTMHFDIVIGRTTQVVVNLSSEWSAFTTTEDFEAHLDDANAHSLLPHFGNRISSADSVQDLWANDGDGKLKPLDLHKAKAIILGSDSSTIPILAGRVSQLELELENIGIQTMIKEELDLSNMFVYEDFNPANQIDDTSTNVTAITAGSTAIDVESLNGIMQGAWYWVTDGIRAETIQVAAMQNNDELCRIITKSPVENTYNLAQTVLYRSTAGVKNGTVVGAADRRSSVWGPALVWRGQDAEVQTTVELSSGLSNATNFTTFGDAKFTADGYMTLDTSISHSHAVGIALVTPGGGSGRWKRVDEYGDNA